MLRVKSTSAAAQRPHTPLNRPANVRPSSYLIAAKRMRMRAADENGGKQDAGKQQHTPPPNIEGLDKLDPAFVEQLVEKPHTDGVDVARGLEPGQNLVPTDADPADLHQPSEKPTEPEKEGKGQGTAGKQ